MYYTVIFNLRLSYKDLCQSFFYDARFDKMRRGRYSSKILSVYLIITDFNFIKKLFIFSLNKKQIYYHIM